MRNAVLVKNETVVRTRKDSSMLGVFLNTFKESASLVLIAVMFIMGSILALLYGIPVKRVMGSYSYDVLVILIVMELFIMRFLHLSKDFLISLLILLFVLVFIFLENILGLFLQIVNLLKN